MQERRGHILTPSVREEIRELVIDKDFLDGKYIGNVEAQIIENAHEDLARALDDVLPVIRSLYCGDSGSVANNGIKADEIIEQLRLALRGQCSIFRGMPHWRFR